MKLTYHFFEHICITNILRLQGHFDGLSPFTAPNCFVSFFSCLLTTISSPSQNECVINGWWCTIHQLKTGTLLNKIAKPQYN